MSFRSRRIRPLHLLTSGTLISVSLCAATAAHAAEEEAKPAEKKSDEEEVGKEETPEADTATPAETITEGAVDEEEASKEPEASDEPTKSTSTDDKTNTEDESDVGDDDDESWVDLKKASADLEAPDESPKQMPRFRTMLLIEGSLKYGAFAIADEGTSLDDEDAESESLRAGNVAGQVSLGIMPGGRAFMMGGRLRGGSYLGERITRGNVAGEMFFGANFGRNLRGTEFTHISGGFGVEFIPGENQDLLTFNLSGGTVMNNLAFGAGFHVGANDEYAVAMFGMHLGWGHLY